MESTQPAERTRRTQQERRDGTQRLLLEATVSSLIELGCGGTTTLEVERRAGVSRGARIHHFPTKAALLASAVDYLYDHLGDHYEEAFGEAGKGLSDIERFRAGLRLLWSIYRRTEYAAALELQIAARTDTELREHLQRLGDRHRARAWSAARRHFPRQDENKVHALIEALHAAFLGLRLQQGVNGTALGEAAVLGLLDELVAGHLVAGAAHGHK